METINFTFLLLIVGSLICSSSTESTVAIKLSDSAIQVGMGKYAIPVGKTVEFSCKLRQFIGAQLWILRNGDIILERTLDSVGITTVNIDIVGEENTSGLYTCRFYRKLKRKESQAITYTTENTVELTVLTEDHLPLCSSSLGEDGLTDEEMTVFCGTYSPNPPIEDILWRGLETTSENYGSYKFYFADIQLSNQPSEISCGYFGLVDDRSVWTSLCSIPTLTVSQHTRVTMEPTEFNEINATLRFTCTSDPPASLIRWNIFGHSDNIIDDYYTTKINAEMIVNITQAFGKSTLTMPSSAIKLDGVHIVACSTKRENFQMAVSEYMPVPTPDRQTTPLLNTLKQGPPGVTVTPPSTPSSRFSSQTSGSGSAGFIVVIVLLVIIVLILGIISLWLYKNHRTNIKNNNRPTAQLSADGLSVAQRNATYQPLNAQIIAPPAYADLDVGYATMSPPQLDDQHYMEPSMAMKGDQR